MGVDLDYNQYTGFAQIPYKIMEYLMVSNTSIWKLLKYNQPNALQQPDLTMAEKRKLVYKPIPDASDDPNAYCLYTVRFIDDAMTAEMTHLHIYINRVVPQNAQVGTVDICFDVFCHNRIAVLSYPNYKPNRYDVMFEELMKTLNGKDVDTLGRLYFNRSGFSSGSEARLAAFSSNGTYQGHHIVMSVNVG
jgi:hypothetical protein